MDAPPDTSAARGWSCLFQRPEGIVEATRWLLVWLALVSVALLVPGVLMTARGGMLALGMGASLLLGASWIYGYRKQRAPLWFDLGDTIGILGLAVVCPDHRAIVIVVFSSLGFRSLYGTAGQAVARGVLYAAALGALLIVWRSVRPDSSLPEIGSYLSILPVLFLTIFIVRKHSSTLIAGDQSVGRDRVLAATGLQLLLAADRAAILAVSWVALTGFCVATPGLRVIQIKRKGSGLSVDGAAGHFNVLPGMLPHEVLFTSPGQEARILDSEQLDRAVGAPMMWECVIVDQGSDDFWLLVGTPKSTPDQAALSVRALVSQIVLALRNNDAHRELTVQARFDALTGLDNRASLTAHLSAVLDAPTTHYGVHLLFVDLDDFKDVNDGLGHSVGDDVLTTVASRLRQGIRSGDLCARLGGDEFAVLLSDTTSQQAVALAERLVASIAEPFVLDSHRVDIGASIGIATATSRSDVKELVHQADVAMYAAKAQGKSQVVAFHPALLELDRRHAVRRA
jgi:diguanylate cyclase (GGDEF)-like protein